MDAMHLGFLTLRHILLTILVIVIGILFSQLLAMVVSPLGLSQGLFNFIVIMAQSIIWIGGLAWVMKDWDYIGSLFSKVSRKWLVVSFLIGVVALARLVVLAPLGTLPFFQQGIGALESLFTFTQVYEYILFGIVAIIVTPIVEEIVFRGFFYRIFKQYMKPGFAIIVSSLVFGFVHGVPLYAFNAFIVGLVLAWVYEQTDSLWAPIVVHGVNNTIIFVFMIMGIGA